MGGGGTLRMMMTMPDDDNGGSEKSYGSDTMLTIRRRNLELYNQKRVHRSLYRE